MRVLSRWDGLGLAAVLAFALALSLHLHQQRARPPGAGGDDPTAPGAAPVLGEEWLGLHFQGERVGLMHLAKSARPEGGLRYRLETRLRFSALGASQAIDLEVDALLDPRFVLESFRSRLEAGPARLTVSGVVRGQAIELAVESAGATQRRQIALAHPPALQVHLGPALSQAGLSPGKQLTFHVFDPLTQQDQPLEIRVIEQVPLAVMGREVLAWRLEQRLGGRTLEGFVNDRGELLRQELGLGLVAIRETEAEARFGLMEIRAGRAAPDLMRATLIPVAGLPARLGARPRLVLEVSGLPAEGLSVEGGRQALTGSRLVITREVVGAGLPLPVTDAPQETLAAEPLMQVGHPEVLAAARAAVSDAADTVTAARRLVAWLGARLTQQLVPGVPSALETLAVGQGDCNEHANLFAALARSLGVPTRVVVGLAYQEGVFGYHAWNEVLTATGWLSVDPTWGQIPADVGHLRLVTGDLAAQGALLGIFGRLGLTVVE